MRNDGLASSLAALWAHNQSGVRKPKHTFVPPTFGNINSFKGLHRGQNVI